MLYVTVRGSLFYLTTDITFSSGRFESWQAMHGSPLFQTALKRCSCILAHYNVFNVALSLPYLNKVQKMFSFCSQTRATSNKNIYLLHIEALLNKIRSFIFSELLFGHET